MGAFLIEISEHMHNLNSEKRDVVDIQVAFSLGKIICVLVMTLTYVYLTGVNSDICVLMMTLMSVNW